MKNRIALGLGALAFSLVLAAPAFAATKHHARHYHHAVVAPAPAAPSCTIHYQTGCYY
jgi:hypothetical protein